MSLVNAFGEIARDRPSAAGDAHMVSGTKVRWRREFNDVTLADWDVVTGSGMAVSVANSYLTVTTGVTASSQTTITSKQTFTAPFKTSFGFKISQKIVNQDFFVEIVKCDPVTGIPDETVVAAWRISGTDSTTTTVARAEVRNGGPIRVQTGNLTTSTAQTSDAIYEIVLESDEVSFHTKPVDSTAGRSTSTVRNSIAPSPTATYKVRYRIVNGATAPASTTTFTSGFITAVDYSEIQVELTGGPGNALASSALPVNVTGGSVGMLNGTIAANSSVNGTTPYKVLSAASTNAVLIKSTAARVYGYQLANTSTSWRYVKFFNLTTAPVPGTSTVFYTIPLAPSTNTDLYMVIPTSHGTGLGIAITAGSADNDTAVIGANDVVGTIYYA